MELHAYVWNWSCKFLTFAKVQVAIIIIISILFENQNTMSVLQYSGADEEAAGLPPVKSFCTFFSQFKSMGGWWGGIPRKTNIRSLLLASLFMEISLGAEIPSPQLQWVSTVDKYLAAPFWNSKPFHIHTKFRQYLCNWFFRQHACLAW